MTKDKYITMLNASPVHANDYASYSYGVLTVAAYDHELNLDDYNELIAIRTKNIELNRNA